MPAPRLLIGLGVAAAAIVLFLLLRPGGEPDADATSGTTTRAGTAGVMESEPEETTTETEAATDETETDTVGTETDGEPPPPPGPQIATLTILVRGGVPAGGIQRITVERGEEVRIVVRSDTADELHLHGYDLVRRVGPGAPAQFRFRATIPGVFELETHERGVLVGEVEVRP